MKLTRRDPLVERVAQTVGGRLRTARKAKPMTLLDLAAVSGIDAATLSRLERGQVGGWLPYYVKLARVFGIPLAQLFKGIENIVIPPQAPSRGRRGGGSSRSRC